MFSNKTNLNSQSVNISQGHTQLGTLIKINVTLYSYIHIFSFLYHLFIFMKPVIHNVYKIYQHFSNYSFKTEVRTKIVVVLKCKCPGLQKKYK